MTLRHIVSWRLNGETLEQRDAQAASATAVLLSLKDTISSVRALHVYRNELFEGVNFDLTLIADFDDAAGLAEYATHPEHLPVIALMKTITADRTATDFTL